MKNFLVSSTQEAIVFGPIVLSSDHISAGTGLTLTVTISKAGGSFAVPSGAVSEIGNGWYKIAGNATDTNTLGCLVVHVTASTADPFDERFEVVAFNPWSATNLGLSALPTTNPGASGGLPACTSAGVPGVDWSAISNPSTTVTLGGTTIGAVNGISTEILQLLGGELIVCTTAGGSITAGIIFVVATTAIVNKQLAYSSNSGWQLWYDSTNACWTMSVSQGTRGTAYWMSSGDELGPWTPGGTATGTPVLVALRRPSSGKNPSLLNVVNSSGQVVAASVVANVNTNANSTESAIASEITAAQSAIIAAMPSVPTPPSAATIATQVMTDLGTGSALTSLAQATTVASEITTVQTAITAAIGTPIQAGTTVNANVTQIKGVTAGGDPFSIVANGSYGNAQLLTAIQNVQNNTSNLSGIPTVQEIREEMDANSTKLANAATTASLTSAESAIIAVVGSPLQASDYQAAPTAIAIREEMDSNSVKLASAATSSGLGTAQNSILSAIGSPLQSNEYMPPSTAAAIAAATASVLFVDGVTNQLKVNPDHSVILDADSITVANYITVPAAVAVASQDPTVITCLRGDTLHSSLPPMGNLTTRSKLVMTAKLHVSDPDELAVFQVVEGVGLVRLNGSSSTTAATADLTVADPNVGTVNLEIDASVTAEFAVTDLVWDVQAYLSTGIATPINGTMSVIADVTQSVT